MAYIIVMAREEDWIEQRTGDAAHQPLEQRRCHDCGVRRRISVINHLRSSYIFMGYIVMACIMMAYVVMACIAMGYI